MAEFDRLYLVACPREDESKTGVCPSSADTAGRAEEIECDAKRKRVNKAEEKWLEVSCTAAVLHAAVLCQFRYPSPAAHALAEVQQNQLEVCLMDAALLIKPSTPVTKVSNHSNRLHRPLSCVVQEVAAKDISADAATGNEGGSTGAVGMFRALVDTIIGNLELHITNVHIHYEDTTSNPGHSFCIGIMLQEISGHTADADWQRAFVSADALKTLRKVSPCLQHTQLPNST